MEPSASGVERHPRKAFLVLFAIEIWERFGYYGMASLMVLYMVERLGLPDARADIIWGAFSALVYAMPMLGGYLADRVLGARRTLVLGATTLGLGYVLLSIPRSVAFFPAMGIIALGNGLFKVNPNNLVSRLYEGQLLKLDILFTIYYMSLNIGSFVSVLLAPWIKDHPSWTIAIGPLQFDSWHLAFGVSAIGLTLGLLQYGAFQSALRPYGTAPDFQKLHLPKLGAVLGGSLLVAVLVSEIIRHRLVALGVVWLFAGLMIAIFLHLLARGERRERKRVAACIVFTAMSMVCGFLDGFATRARALAWNRHGGMVPGDGSRALRRRGDRRPREHTGGDDRGGGDAPLLHPCVCLAGRGCVGFGSGCDRARAAAEAADGPTRFAGGPRGMGRRLGGCSGCGERTPPLAW